MNAWMRWSAGVVLLAVACIGFVGASKPPGVTLAEPGLGFTIVNDSTVKLKMRVYLRNWIQATDTLRYDYFRGDTLRATNRSVFTLDSAFVFTPERGQTATFKGCAQVERGGRASGVTSAPSCWSWTYTRPALPPVIDSVKQIVLRSIPVDARAVAQFTGQPAAADSNYIQFCAFAVLKSGRKIMTTNSAPVPVCQTAYQSWLSETPA